MLQTTEADTVCVVRRWFAKPVALVYRAWTDPDWVRRWSWGRKYETVSIELDCKVGGSYRTQIRDKKTGENWFFEGVFQDVRPYVRLVHTFHWRSDGGYEHGPSLVAIDFVETGTGTEVIITHTQLASVQEKKGTEAGWIDIFDCIDACLAADAGNECVPIQGQGC